jgi:capsular exopolysaccharide synthesis family protein
MNRIVEALERARRDQTVAGPVPIELLHEAPPRSVAEDARSIAYTRTRVVPVSHEMLQRNRVISDDQRSPAAAAYKILCTQVLRRAGSRGAKALAVVSPGPREGKTLTAINLALSLSREVGQTVLLVDADLRQPSVHSYFGMAASPGLSEHLMRRIPLERALVNPGISDFVVLPGGEPLANSAEMLASKRMQQLVDELKNRYASRMVVFDLPPVLTSADAMAFSPFVDGTIMVVQEGRTAAEEIARAAEMLESANLIGMVLNDSRSPATGELAINVQGEARSSVWRWGRRP